jgi:DNA repair protein RecN (Recombination protein N)
VLQSLTIRNIAVIDRLHIDFEKGFSVFTGETGAGKSILLDSLSFVLGNRGSLTRLIRDGEEEASVTLVVESLPSSALALLQEQGLEIEETLIIRRIIHREGKTKAFLNDQPISITFLNHLSSHLLEIHGQFDHLLSPAQQLHALDRYAQFSGEKLEKAYLQWKKEEEALKDAQHHFSNKERRLEELSFVIEELQTLNPKKQEEEHLLALKEQGKNTDQLETALKLVRELFEEPAHIENKIFSLQRHVDRTSIESLSRLKVPVEAILMALQDLREETRHLEFMVTQSITQSLDDIEGRLYALRQMARKYHVSPEELVSMLETLQQEKKTLLNAGSSLDHLQQQVKEARDSYIKLSDQAAHSRQKAGKDLSRQIEEALHPLKLPHAQFSISFQELPETQWSAAGRHHIEFHISTNPGLSPGPLSKIASGGELSRVMLAIKSLLKEKAHIPTLIFDEIDVGLGGGVAAAMGEKLSLLSDDSQVLAITHSPQLAAYADHHFGVSKEVCDNKTVTSIHCLDPQERIEELSRMLAGKNITDLTRAAAQELLKDKVSG